jgi:hypothetical protein
MERLTRPLQDRHLATLSPVQKRTERGGCIELTPASTSACAITVHVDRADTAIVVVGPNRTDLELWAEPVGELVRDVCVWVDAIIQGKYRERVKYADGAPQRAIATITLRDGSVQTYYSHVASKLLSLGRGWVDHTYAPYDVRIGG